MIDRDDVDVAVAVAVSLLRPAVGRGHPNEYSDLQLRVENGWWRTLLFRVRSDRGCDFCCRR